MIVRTNHNINKMIALNNVDKKYERDDYKNKIIKTVKIEKEKIDIKKEIEKKKLQLNQVEEEGIKKRTNYPYKGIIKKFDYNKTVENPKDLIVFRPDDEEKDKFNENAKKYLNTIKEQDDELKKVYTSDKKEEYCKKFEYVQKYKYKIEVSDDNDKETYGDNLRKERIEHYEKQKEENLNNNVSIIDELFKEGIINEDLTNINYDKIDVDVLEKKLIEKFGKEKYLSLINSM